MATPWDPGSGNPVLLLEYCKSSFSLFQGGLQPLLHLQVVECLLQEGEMLEGLDPVSLLMCFELCLPLLELVILHGNFCEPTHTSAWSAVGFLSGWTS
jgi:hypothetical protein